MLLYQYLLLYYYYNNSIFICIHVYNFEHFVYDNNKINKTKTINNKFFIADNCPYTHIKKTFKIQTYLYK